MAVPVPPAPQVRKPPKHGIDYAVAGIASYLLIDDRVRAYLIEGVFEGHTSLYVKQLFNNNNWLNKYKTTHHELLSDLQATSFYSKLRQQARRARTDILEDSLLIGDDFDNLPTVLTGKDGGNGEDLAPNYLRLAQAQVNRKQWLLQRLDPSRYGSQLEIPQETTKPLGIVVMPPKESPNGTP